MRAEALRWFATLLEHLAFADGGVDEARLVELAVALQPQPRALLLARLGARQHHPQLLHLPRGSPRC